MCPSYSREDTRAHSISFLLCAILLLISYPAHSQGPIESVVQQYAPTPKALEQSRYGNLSLNQNSGALALEIPIGSYTDQDFDIPISISYSNSGFKPERPSGEAGLGWSLVAGGSITREIVGLDDFSPSGGYNSYHSNYSPSSIYSFGHTVTTVNGYTSIDGGAHETTSDIYHFSFPGGHTGSFIIDNYGNFTPFSTSGEKGTYDISYDNGTFTILTSDGMTWTFGSSMTSREIMLRQNGIHDTSAQQLSELNGDLPVVTWLLDKIEAPDGRYVQLEFCSTRNYQSIPSEGDDVITTFSRSANKVGNTTKYKFASLVCTSYLSKIKVYESANSSKTVASFDWERKDYPEINGTEQFDYRKMIVKTRRLTGIALTEGADTLRTASLTYDDSRKRPLLTSVSIPVYGTWTFDYNLPANGANFPGQLSNAVDFWGFYNGNDSNLDNLIAPTTVNAISLNESLNTYAMDPDADYSKVGTLKRIVWPTGGSSTITYESHSAKKILLRRRYPSLPPIPQPEDRYVNAFYVSMENVTAILHNNNCGGVRVKKIKEDSVVDGSSERTFTYTDDTGANSGIIQEFNRYYAGKVGGYDFMNPFLKYPGNGFDINHIAYTSVVETLSDGTSIRTDFTSWKDNPDEFSANKYPHNTVTFGYGETYDIFVDNIQREADSRAYRRGKPVKRTMTDATGNKIKEELYTYEDSGDGYAAYVVTSGHYYWSARRFLCDRLMTEKETIFYPSPGQEIHSSTTYVYDVEGRITDIENNDSDGAVYNTIYTYHSGTLQPSLITSVRKSTQPAGSSVTYNTENIAYSYSHTGNLWNKMSETRTLYNASGTGTDADVTQYSYYDSYGHPWQVVVNQDTTAIVWGHKGRYPVASVKNCPYTALPTSLRNVLNGNIQDVGVKALYELQGKAVRVLSWAPSVGMIREIGPSGRSTIFEYDSNKRLSGIKDASGTLLKGFSYGMTPILSGVSLRYVETAVNTGSAIRSEKNIFDGLGREWLEAIAPSGTVNPEYLMSLCTHDGLSRETRKYLPFTDTNLYPDLAETIQNIFWGHEEGPYAYSSTTYTGGLLALPVQENLPGKALHDADKHTTITRKVNSFYEVPRLVNNESATSVRVLGYYQGGSLIKTETVSPDGDSLFVFSTAMGREVLRRAVSGNTMLDTYTVGDRLGQTVCVLSPMLADTIRTAAASGISTALLFDSEKMKDGGYLFEYDNNGNIKHFSTPGVAKDERKYDVSHRIKTYYPSTSAQLTKRLYISHAYDGAGRETETTIYRSGLSYFDDPHPLNSKKPPFLFEDTLLGTLTSRVYGQSTSVDCIETDSPGTPYSSVPSNLVFAARGGVVTGYDLHVTGELILENQWPLKTPMKPLTFHFGSFEYGDGMLGDTPATTVYYYDSHGRVSQSVTSWPDGGISRNSYSHDLEGNILASLEEHTPAGATSDSNDWVWTENEYDTRGNMLTSSVWIGRCAVPSKQDASLTYTEDYTYDGIGRQTGSTLSGNGHSISKSLTHTVQGWISNLTYAVDDTLSFRETLAYWNPTHQGVQARYGGGISEATTQHRDYPARSEGYSYDGFFRLTGTTSFIGESNVPLNNNVENNISYDATGNITSITRKGPSGADIANMTFTYSGNKQTGALDSVSGESWSNTYCEDGTIKQSGSTGYTYADNLIGQIAQVQGEDIFPGGGTLVNIVASYSYLPDGTKLDVAGNGKTTIYRGAFTYTKSGVNSNRTLESISLPGMIIVVNNGVYTPLSIATDHLGNVRALVDMSTGSVVERSDYYTYGGRITQPSGTLQAYPTFSANRWRLAGKEEQDNVASLPYVDFGARQYDPVSVSWVAPDPLAADSPDISPYSYCADNPVNYVDPDGRKFRKTRHFNRITISANYYAANRESYNAAKQGVDFWNRRNNDVYIDDSGRMFIIQYRLTVTEANARDELKEHENTFEINDSKVDKTATNNAAGITLDKKHIYVKKAYSTKKPNTDYYSSTAAHEIGHTLGMEHSPTGVMSVSQDVNRSGDVLGENINQMINSEPPVSDSKTTWITILYESIKKEAQRLLDR